MISSIYSTSIPLTQLWKRKGKTKRKLESDYREALGSTPDKKGTSRKRKSKTAVKIKCVRKRKASERVAERNLKEQERLNAKREQSRQERIRLYGSDLRATTKQ